MAFGAFAYVQAIHSGGQVLKIQVMGANAVS